MLLALKILHFLCLFGAGAGMIGNGILLRKVIVSGEAPPPILVSAMRLIGSIGLASILLLWVSGLWMMYLLGIEMTLPFFIKLAAASVVLILVGTISFSSASAVKEGKAPDGAIVKKLSTAASVAGIIAVIAAVFSFN